MKNGKKQNMDNEKKFLKVETVLSTGDMEILAESEYNLKCSHPNSSVYVDFKVEPMNTGQSLNGHFYNLFCDSRYIVHKHNLEKNHVLTHKKYENTLQQWLVNNGNNWCEIYEGWGINRPKEDARKIIQGILKAVYKLHKNGSFHGFLHHPENFAMDTDELVIGGDHKEIKHISLIHANVKCDQSARRSGDGNLQEEMKNDIQAMTKVIFKKILRGKHAASYPLDLGDLYVSLQKATGNTNELGYIVNHPSLWHWKSRFNYIGSVYMCYQHGNDCTREQMTTEFNNINVGCWAERITNDPLRKIFQHDKYRKSAYQLLRYLRNAHVHYKEYEVDPRTKIGKYTYINLETEHVYLNEKYFELKTSEVGGHFLVDLYEMMRRLRLEI